MERLLELTQALLDEAKIANKLSAIAITKNLSAEGQIQLLDQIGIKPKDIADVLGKTPNYVSVTLHKLRKKKTKSEGK